MNAMQPVITMNLERNAAVVDDIIIIIIIIIINHEYYYGGAITKLYCRTDHLKVGFHYPSSRAEFTGRVDGPRTRVHFLTPVNSGRELG